MDPGTGWVTGKYGYGLNFDIENVKLEICKANLQANSPTVNFLFSINREPEGNCSFAAIYEKCEAFPISPFGNDDYILMSRSNCDFSSQFFAMEKLDIAKSVKINYGLQPQFADNIDLTLKNKEFNHDEGGDKQ